MNDNFILGFASPVQMKKVVNLHCGIYDNYYSLNLNTGGTRILLQLESSRIDLLALDLGTTKRTTVTIYPPECRLSNLQWRARNKPGIATVTSSFANPLRNRFENVKLRKYVEKTECCRYRLAREIVIQDEQPCYRSMRRDSGGICRRNRSPESTPELPIHECPRAFHP